MYHLSDNPIRGDAGTFSCGSGAHTRLIVLLWATTLIAPCANGQEPECDDCGPRRPLIAAAEITAANLLTWSYDRYLQDARWADVSPGTWAKNLKRGLVWDGNRLTANQVMHPLHGAVFFNAGRSNGFGFWTSIAGAMLGSLTWEYMAETYPAAPNDLLNTVIGGAALGETMFRLSGVLRSARGAGSGMRRAAGAILNPLSVVPGSAWSRGPGVPEHLHVDAVAGMDHALGDLGSRDARFRPVLDVTVVYGHPLQDLVRRPFDVFEFRLRLGRGISSGRRWGPENPIDRLESRGALFSRLVSTDGLSIGVYQHIDFLRSPAVEFGAQSLTAAVFRRQALSPSTEWSSSVHLGAIVFGSSPARFRQRGPRTNDYGPGAVLKLDSRLSRKGSDLLRIEARAHWLHDFASTRGDHIVVLVGGEARVPLGRGFGLGAAMELSGHASFGDQLRHPHAIASSARFALTWSTRR